MFEAVLLLLDATGLESMFLCFLLLGTCFRDYFRYLLSRLPCQWPSQAGLGVGVKLLGLFFVLCSLFCVCYSCFLFTAGLSVSCWPVIWRFFFNVGVLQSWRFAPCWQYDAPSGLFCFESLKDNGQPRAAILSLRFDSAQRAISRLLSLA